MARVYKGDMVKYFDGKGLECPAIVCRIDEETDKAVLCVFGPTGSPFSATVKHEDDVENKKVDHPDQIEPYFVD